MKKLLMCLVIFIGFTWNVNAEETVKVATLEWPPYSGEKLPGYGTTCIKITKLFKSIGVSASFVSLPWERAKLRTPEIIGYGPAWKEEVGDGYVAIGPIDKSVIGLIAKESTAVPSEYTLDDIAKNYDIGIVKTYEYPQGILTALGAYGRINQKSPINDLFLAKMLNIGRFHLSLTDPNVAKYYQTTENLEPVKVVKVIEDKDLYIAINNIPANQSIITRLKAVIEKGAIK